MPGMCLPPPRAAAPLLILVLGACSAAPPGYTELGDGLPGPKIWSEAVIPFDANGDARIDLLFVNANGWRRPGDMGASSTDPLSPTLLINRGNGAGGPMFEDRTAHLLPSNLLIHGKNAAVCDVNGDGHNDIALAVAFGARQLLMHGNRQKRAPDGDQDAETNAAAAEDPYQISLGYGEDVAEQVAHQIDPHPLHEGKDDDPDGQRRVREDSEQGVGRQLGCALQEDDGNGETNTGQRDADGHVDRQQKAECHA